MYKTEKYRLERMPYLILRLGLPLITAVFAYIIIYIMKTPVEKQCLLLISVPEMLSCVMLSLVLLVAGALLLDIDIKQKK